MTIINLYFLQIAYILKYSKLSYAVNLRVQLAMKIGDIRNFLPRGSRMRWLLATVFIFTLNASASESRFSDHHRHTQRLASAQQVTMEQAINRVRRDTGGRVLSAAPTNKAGLHGYRVRVLLDGKRVRQIFVRSHDKPKR